MAKIESQNIPAPFQQSYRQVLQPATDSTGLSIYGAAIYGQALYGGKAKQVVGKRKPFRVPSRETKKEDDDNDQHTGPSAAQLKVRQAFRRSVFCFNMQPQSGGQTPPNKGPRARSWWFEQAGTEWYYNYFMSQTIPIYLANQTPDWCVYEYGGQGGYACAVDEFSQEHIVDDGVELPFGSTYLGWPNESAISRAAVSVDLTQWSYEQLQDASSLTCVFTYNGMTDNSFSCFAYTWPADANQPPDFLYDIPNTGQLLLEWANTHTESIHQFDCLNFLRSEKAAERTTAYFAFLGSIEMFSTVDYSGEIYGPNHPSAPMTFLLA